MALVALGLACGGCVGWTFALAVDIVRPVRVEVERRAPVTSPSRAPDGWNVTGY